MLVMIYITGDTHNTEDMSNVSADNMKLCCAEQNVDYSKITNLIILGDFGLPLYECPVDESGIHPTNKTDKYLLKWYNKKPFKILCVMGNHDNYDMIKKLPEVNMFGSSVLKVSENIYYLMRGEVYNIEGHSFLVLGGAKSDDKEFRKPHKNWWPDEELNEEEKENCLLHINSYYKKKFDYILSHTGPSKGIACVDSYYLNEENCKQLKSDSTVCFNDEIDKIISYKKWFFGHWHSDWGYENFMNTKYVPLYRMGIVVPESVPKTYLLNSVGNEKEYMFILREMEDGYIVKITRNIDGKENVHTDYISKTLFNSCIRTGFLKEIK